MTEKNEMIDDVIDEVWGGMFRFEMRREQREIIRSVLKGEHVFGVLPTGFGKSACFGILPDAFDLVSMNYFVLSCIKTALWPHWAGSIHYFYL
jgi:Lhr-like helicase